MFTKTQRIKLKTTFLDISKTLSAAFFIWMMVKGLFPSDAQGHEQGRWMLGVLTGLFLYVAVILSLEIAKLEDEL